MPIHPHYSTFELFSKRLLLSETNPEFQLMRYQLAHMSALVYNKKMYLFFLSTTCIAKKSLRLVDVNALD